MLKQLRNLRTHKIRLQGNRIVLGVVGVLVAATVGSAGVASAQTAPHTAMLPTKASCATLWKPYGFKNRGACESFWDKHKHDPHPGQGNGGHGYGGNISTGVAVTINGDNNVVTVIINYFF